MLIQRLLVALLLLGMQTAALSQANVYENAQNLKVLPKDTSADTLRETMKRFALDTGFRCSSCHVGEEGQSLAEYDFASDEKELKGKARLMLRMVNTINADLLSEFGEERTEVRCVTCHRGINKPVLIGDVLTEAANENGVEGMQKKYRELRQRYHGSHSFDFSDMTLTEFARSRAEAGHPDQATAMLDLVLENSPDSFMAHFSYAEFFHRAGDTEKAIEHYKAAIKANPDAAGFLQQRIEKLELPEDN